MPETCSSLGCAQCPRIPKPRRMQYKEEDRASEALGMGRGGFDPHALAESIELAGFMGRRQRGLLHLITSRVKGLVWSSSRRQECKSMQNTIFPEKNMRQHQATGEDI